MQINKQNFMKLHILLLLLLTIAQNIIIINFGNFSLKLYHAFSLTFIPYLFFYKIKIPSLKIIIPFSFFGIVTIVGFSLYGFDSLVFNYLFGFYYILIFTTLFSNMKKQEIMEIFKCFVIITFFICSINIVFHLDAIKYYIENPNGGHPIIDTIISGGVNIEATWLAFFVILLFDKKKLRYVFLLLSLVISILYSSRAGIIANLGVFGLLAYRVYKDKDRNHMAFLAVITCIGVVYLLNSDFFALLISRFLSIGKENGSLGRIEMWKEVFSAFKRNPFGYGAGNAIKAIPEFSVLYGENNLHNVYLQYLLDFGFIGFVYIVGIFIYFIIESIKNYKNLFGNILLLYFVLAFVEFRGGDSLFFIFLAGWLSLNGKKEKKYSELKNVDEELIMDEKLVSVVVPVYNVEKYLGKCIESLLNQTYKNIEIILVDDGSKDNCGQICDCYSGKDERIKVIHKINGGLSDARNEGIKISKGEYITFIDSDDYVDSKYVEVLYKMITKNEADISIIELEEALESYEHKENKKEISANTYEQKEAIEAMLIKKISHCACGKMYKINLFRDIRFPVGKLYEDLGIMYKIFLLAEKVVYSNCGLYIYTIREGSIMHQNIFNDRQLVEIDFIEESTSLVENKYPELHNYCVVRKVATFFEVLSRILKSKNSNDYKQTKKELLNKIHKYKYAVLKNFEAPTSLKIKIISLLFGTKSYYFIQKINDKIKYNKLIKKSKVNNREEKVENE